MVFRITSSKNDIYDIFFYLFIDIYFTYDISCLDNFLGLQYRLYSFSFACNILTYN